MSTPVSPHNPGPDPVADDARILKLRALGLLVPCVVHRLNNVLVTVRGTCEIARETDAAPDYELLFDRLQLLGDWLRRLVHMVRDPDPDPAREDAGALLERTAALLRPLYDERRVPIRCETVEGVWLEGPIALFEQHLVQRLAVLALTRESWGPLTLGLAPDGDGELALNVTWEGEPEHAHELQDDAGRLALAFGGEHRQLSDGWSYRLGWSESRDAVVGTRAAVPVGEVRRAVLVLAPEGESTDLFLEVLAEEGWPVRHVRTAAELEAEGGVHAVLLDAGCEAGHGQGFEVVRSWCGEHAAQLVLLASDADPRPDGLEGIALLQKPVGPSELLAALQPRS